MTLRATLLLLLAISASIAATLTFQDEVIIALGLILLQVKILWLKLIAVKPPQILAWIKQQGSVFLSKDLPYKYLSSVVVPMTVGKRLLRRLSALVSRLLDPIRAQVARLRSWYEAQTGLARAGLAVTLLAATLALTVGTIGIWIVLFSVTVPLWLAATLLTIGRMVLASGQKYVFKLIAFLQLRWLWNGLRRILPSAWLQKQRRLNLRIARSIIRRRKLTARTLAHRKDDLSYRLALAWDILRQRVSDR